MDNEMQNNGMQNNGKMGYWGLAGLILNGLLLGLLIGTSVCYLLGSEEESEDNALGEESVTREDSNIPTYDMTEDSTVEDNAVAGLPNFLADSIDLTEPLKESPTENLNEEPSIETLRFFGTSYEDMAFLGEPISVTPLDVESIILLQGYFVIAEYDGLIMTLNTKEDFIIGPGSAGVTAVTALSDAYTDSNGIKVGTSKEELMQKFSLDETDFLSGENNEEAYRIHENHAGSIYNHNIPEYDYFYPAHNGANPVVLIYLLKDDCVNGILLRHLTAG